MHKIKTKQIDGYEIILGIQPLSIDPKSTQSSAFPALLDMQESKDLVKKQEEKGRNLKEAGAAGKRAEFAAKAAVEEGAKPIRDENNPQHLAMATDLFLDPKRLAKFQADVAKEEKKRSDRLGAVGVCDEQCKVLHAQVNKKHADTLRGNPVFGLPGPGEYIDRGLKIVGPDSEGKPVLLTETEQEVAGLFFPGGQTVAEMTALWMACGDTQKLCVDGSYVDDFRGKTEWLIIDGSWLGYTLKELGEEKNSNASFYDDLTDEQRAEITTEQETERIAGLSEEDRLAEYETKKAALAAEAQAMETTLKFDSKDIAPAQAWYDAGLADLKLKYGVGE